MKLTVEALKIIGKIKRQELDPEGLKEAFLMQCRLKSGVFDKALLDALKDNKRYSLVLEDHLKDLESEAAYNNEQLAFAKTAIKGRLIEDHGDFSRVHNVEYRGKKNSYDVSHNIIGIKKSSRYYGGRDRLGNTDWIYDKKIKYELGSELVDDAKYAEDFKIVELPLYMAIMKNVIGENNKVRALFEKVVGVSRLYLRNSSSEQIGHRRVAPGTLVTTSFAQSGPDGITLEHCCGQEQYTTQYNSESSRNELCMAFFGQTYQEANNTIMRALRPLNDHDCEWKFNLNPKMLGKRSYVVLRRYDHFGEMRVTQNCEITESGARRDYGGISIGVRKAR